MYAWLALELIIMAAVCCLAAALAHRDGQRKAAYAAELHWQPVVTELRDRIRILMRLGPDAFAPEDRPAPAPRHARTTPRQQDQAPAAGAPRFHIVPQPMPASGAYEIIAKFPGSQPSGVTAAATTDTWKYTTGEMKALTDEEFLAALEAK